jgi:hypothetical protein
MVGTHLLALAVLLALLLGWLAVQRAWARVFREDAAAADALAGRASCAGGGCAEVCERRPCEAGSAREEGTR